MLAEISDELNSDALESQRSLTSAQSHFNIDEPLLVAPLVPVSQLTVGAVERFSLNPAMTG